MVDSGGQRPARVVGIKEVAAVLQKSRRTIERMITRGDLPQPVKPTPNSTVFPLEDLIPWAKKKGDTLAAEFERLAFAPAADLRPEALSEIAAKQISRALGEKIAPYQVVFGAIRQLTPNERQARRAAVLREVEEGLAQLFPPLDFTRAPGLGRNGSDTKPRSAPDHLPDAVHERFRDKVFLYREANLLLAFVGLAQEDPIFEQPLQEYERILFSEPPSTPGGAARLQALKAAMLDLRDRLNARGKEFTWSRNWFATIGHDEDIPETLMQFVLLWSRFYVNAHKRLREMVA
jgi:predicted DNA-binding transcriptional regulator AlpA